MKKKAWPIKETEQLQALLFQVSTEWKKCQLIYIHLFTWVMNNLRNTSSQTQIAFISAQLMFQSHIYFSVSINVKHHFFSFFLKKKKRFTSTFYGTQGKWAAGS